MCCLSRPSACQFSHSLGSALFVWYGEVQHENSPGLKGLQGILACAREHTLLLYGRATAIKTTNIKIVNMKSKMTLFIFLIHIPDLKEIVHLKTKRNPYNWLLLNIRDNLMNIHLGEFNTIQDIASHFNAWLMNINVAITLRCSQRWISEHLKFTSQCFWKRFQKCMQSTPYVQSVLA